MALAARDVTQQQALEAKAHVSFLTRSQPALMCYRMIQRYSTSLLALKPSTANQN